MRSCPRQFAIKGAPDVVSDSRIAVNPPDSESVVEGTLAPGIGGDAAGDAGCGAAAPPVAGSDGGEFWT